MQAAVVAADFTVDAACFASLVVHHSQLGRGGVSGGALRGGASGLADDRGVGVSQERLSKVGLLQYLPAFVHKPGGKIKAGQRERRKLE